MNVAWQQAPGLWPTDLQRHDLSAPGRELVQSRRGTAELATYLVEKGKPFLVVVD
jgi:hypothetical protein